MKRKAGLFLAALALSCLVGWTAGAQKPRPELTTWEYKVLTYACAGDKTLNDLGTQGWELIATDQRMRGGGGYDCPTLYFKRPLVNK